MADKIYRLRIPQVLDEELQDVAARLEMSLETLLQRFVKLGLTVHKVGLSESSELILREGERETKISLL